MFENSLMEEKKKAMPNSFSADKKTDESSMDLVRGSMSEKSELYGNAKGMTSPGKGGFSSVLESSGTAEGQKLAPLHNTSAPVVQASLASWKKDRKARKEQEKAAAASQKSSVPKAAAAPKVPAAAANAGKAAPAAQSQPVNPLKEKLSAVRDRLFSMDKYKKMLDMRLPPVVEREYLRMQSEVPLGYAKRHGEYWKEKYGPAVDRGYVESVDDSAVLKEGEDALSSDELKGRKESLKTQLNMDFIGGMDALAKNFVAKKLSVEEMMVMLEYTSASFKEYNAVS